MPGLIFFFIFFFFLESAAIQSVTYYELCGKLQVTQFDDNMKL